MPRRRARPRRAAYTYPNGFRPEPRPDQGGVRSDMGGAGPPARHQHSQRLALAPGRAAKRPPPPCSPGSCRPHGPRPPAAHGQGPPPLPATSSPGVAVMKSLAGGYPRCPAPRHSPPRLSTMRRTGSFPVAPITRGEQRPWNPHVPARLGKPRPDLLPETRRPPMTPSRLRSAGGRVREHRAWSELWRRLLDGLPPKSNPLRGESDRNRTRSGTST